MYNVLLIIVQEVTPLSVLFLSQQLCCFTLQHTVAYIAYLCFIYIYIYIYIYYYTELYDRPNRPENLEVEPDEEVDTDEKGPYILQSEVEKAIKKMRNKKATGDNDVPGGVLKLLGEGGLKITTKLMNTIYETGEWPKDLTEVTMIALKKKLQNAATIGSQSYRTYRKDSSKDT